MLHGSRTFRSFELERGYSPSIVDDPWTMVDGELLRANIQMAATRAVQKLIKSKNPRTVSEHVVKSEMNNYVWLVLLNQNVPAEWIVTTVFKALNHSVQCRRSNRGLPLNVSYDQVCIETSRKITRELLSESVGDIFGGPEDQLCSEDIRDSLDDSNILQRTQVQNPDSAQHDQIPSLQKGENKEL